jgi:ribosome-binding protein aMBF1 (putative translation factor)
MMSKFLFVVFMVMLLVSFLKNPESVAGSVADSANTYQSKKAVFPIGEQIKIARLQSHIKLGELSRKTGIPRYNLEQIEKNQILPSSDIVQNLEAELKVNLVPIKD